MTSAIAELRARTMDAHVCVDAAFSLYDLNDRDDYRAFLSAHARALPVAEAMVATAATLPPTRVRTPLLAADMALLGQPMPGLPTIAGPKDSADAWGTLYVLEGSRFGGGVLTKRVAAGLPTGYLSARHEPGEWRGLCRAIDAEAEQHDAAWIDRAVTGAEACFALYLRACAA